MHRTVRWRFLALAGPLAAVVAGLFIVFMLMGSQEAPKAQGVVPTNTPTAGPTATPKPSGTSPVGGLGTIDVGGSPPLYRCIIWTDSNAANEVKATAQCIPFIGVEFSGGEPPCEAVHTTGGAPQAVVPGEGNCSGHSGPPPYTPLKPFKLFGTYNPAGTGTVTLTGCFEDIGTSVGPNAVARITYTGATAFWTTAPPGTTIPLGVEFWLNQDNAACTAAQTPPYTVPSSPLTLPATLIREADTLDRDGDGCDDRDELLQGKGSTAKCGDDPFSPVEAVTGSPLDVTGSYDVRARAVRNNSQGGAAYVLANAGLYYECKADMQQSGKNLTARILCYIDSGAITVNPQAANCQVNPGGACASGHVFNCGPADIKYCGDGMPGTSPPGCSVAAKTASSCATLANQPPAGCPTLPCDVSQYQFADVDDRHTVLLGTLDNTLNTVNLSGCFEDRDGHGALGNVYVRAKINAHTGVGVVLVWVGQMTAACTSGSPVGSGSKFTVAFTRQEPGIKPGQNPRDSDGDGCPDKRELSDTAAGNAGGGLRDPVNRWDYFNPEKVNTPNNQSVSDIIRTVQQFGKDQGNAAYTIDTDRTGLIGGNAWNLGPPDGQQRVTDILAAVKQFNHNCAKGP